MASNFHCIIRQQGTTGPEGIWDQFFANDPAEGKATLTRRLNQLPGGMILTLNGPKAYEVQIFDLRA